MCIAAALAPLATGAGMLSTIGTVLSVGGALMQGAQAKSAADAQAAAIEVQAAQEAQINATQDQRRREEFRIAGAEQVAQLAARGITLDSPTALVLGRSLAQEMSFESQAIRSGGAARQEELSNSAMLARAKGQSDLLRGRVSAASTLLTAAPELWPGLKGA